MHIKQYEISKAVQGDQLAGDMVYRIPDAVHTRIEQIERAFKERSTTVPEEEFPLYKFENLSRIGSGSFGEVFSLLSFFYLFSSLGFSFPFIVTLLYSS